jgi:hypothetical protein
MLHGITEYRAKQTHNAIGGRLAATNPEPRRGALSQWWRPSFPRQCRAADFDVGCCDGRDLKFADEWLDVSIDATPIDR